MTPRKGADESADEKEIVQYFPVSKLIMLRISPSSPAGGGGVDAVVDDVHESVVAALATELRDSRRVVNITCDEPRLKLVIRDHGFKWELLDGDEILCTSLGALKEAVKARLISGELNSAAEATEPPPADAKDADDGDKEEVASVTSTAPSPPSRDAAHEVWTTLSALEKAIEHTTPKSEYVFLSEPFHFLKIPLPFLESAR